MTRRTGLDVPVTGALGALAISVGEPRASAMNQPVDLCDPGFVWFIERGSLDISLAECGEQGIESPFKHLLRVEAGRLAFALERQAADGLKLIGKGLPGTLVRRIPVPRLIKELAKESDGDLTEEIAVAVDAWIGDFAAAVTKNVEPRPQPTVRLSAEPGAGPPVQGILFAERGVVWLAGNKLEAAFLQLQDARSDGPGLMPVTREAWVELHSANGVASVASRDLGIDALLGQALPEFHRLALGAEAVERQLRMADEANLQVAEVYQRRRDESSARRGLASLTSSRRGETVPDDQPLIAALRAIGRHEGFTIESPMPVLGREPTLQEILAASRIRARRVRLSNDERWWLGDSGALLAFLRHGNQPVVLLPGAGGHYRLLDPVSGKWRRASAETTGDLLEEVWFFYGSLPVGEPLGIKDLFSEACGSLSRDLIRLVLTGICAGILALAPALAVNFLVGSVLPSGRPAALAQFTAVFVGVALAASLVHMLRGTALMRLEGRLAARLGVAVWDRLLRLDTTFFRDYMAGDLAARAMTFQSLRDQVAGIVAEALLSTLFLLPMFGLVFFFDPALGWLTLGLGLAAVAITAAFGIRMIEPQRKYLSLERRLSGDLLQFLRGISKLHMTCAEGSAYAAWAKRFRMQKLAEIQVSVLSEHIAAFSAALPAFGGAALFMVALQRGEDHLAPADFLAVYAASMVFYMAVASLGQSLKAVSAVIPGCEQVRPILQAVPNAPANVGLRVLLDGAVSFQGVSFRYDADGPAILDDVSLHAEPGEFIGIVGESGSGKSTLFRVALGLEDPLVGAVYYDGRDLAHLDRDAVRRQLGVVTQDGSLVGDKVLTNIVGVGEELTERDAWRAARHAAVDRDIAAMPMKMMTVVGENGSTFSGGQRQRIRIAGALVHDPRILFLDEPTSWLDARSQSETMRGIETAVCTRFVIAHRLSTIRNADRIYVLHAGRVVQFGRYDELIAVEGRFRDLAERQVL